MKKWMRVISLVSCLVLAVSPLASQQGASKEAVKFRSQIEDTRKSVEGARDQIRKILEGYNELVEGKAKKVEPAYKKLGGDVSKVEKTVGGLQKQVTGMDKTAEKFFAEWEGQIAAYQSESMQAHAGERFDLAKRKYDEMRSNMTEAGGVYDPFMISLKDQIQFLGNDLSPEAMEGLAPEVEKLNGMGDDLFAKIERILSDEVADEEEFDEAINEETDDEADEETTDEADEETTDETEDEASDAEEEEEPF